MRKFIHEVIGDKHAENLRKIISNTVEKEWQVPGKRFSPLLRDHLLYFVTKQRHNLESQLFPEILQTKFEEEYGYTDCPAVLPKLIQDLTAKIRLYFSEQGKEILVIPVGSKNSDKAKFSPFQEAFRLYLERVSIDDRFKESIRDLTGLPTSFLKKLFNDFESISTDSVGQTKQARMKSFSRFIATRIEK